MIIALRAGTEVPAYNRIALNWRVGAYFSARHERIAYEYSAGYGILSIALFRLANLPVSLRPETPAGWAGGNS